MNSFVFNPNYAASMPIYRQLAFVIAKAIESGELEHLSPLPHIKDLSRSSSISRETAARAYCYLTEQGKAVEIDGKGFCVRSCNGLIS